jgi:hypothetical protein
LAASISVQNNCRSARHSRSRNANESGRSSHN